MILAAALVALPTLAQNFGKPYKPKYDQAQKQQVVATTTAPSTTFQSTSTMSGSGSAYSAAPSLNGDGTAAYAAPSGPRRAKMEGEGSGSGSGEGSGGMGAIDPDDPNNSPGLDTPLGDTLFPLLLMSLAFGMFVYFRRKRSAA